MKGRTPRPEAMHTMTLTRFYAYLAALEAQLLK
jgi:hypothetical protein